MKVALFSSTLAIALALGSSEGRAEIASPSAIPAVLAGLSQGEETAGATYRMLSADEMKAVTGEALFVNGKMISVLPKAANIQITFVRRTLSITTTRLP
jgi:hypothetical protein